MPKKFHRRLYTKPASTPPVTLASSSSSSKGRDGHSSSQQDEQPHTVNDLLNHLRSSQNNISEEAGSSNSNSFNALELSNQRTLHPSLNELLGVTLPPPPRPPRRPRGGQVGTRRSVAGPPPPASWLQNSLNNVNNSTALNTNNSGAPSWRTNSQGLRQENRELIRRNVYHLPGQEVIDPSTLLYCAMKHIASNWQFHIVYNQHYLYTLRPALKSLLLSYVITYNKQDILDLESLNMLCHGPKQEIVLEQGQHVQESWDTGNDSDEDVLTDSNEEYDAHHMVHLDLSHNVGNGLSLKDIKHTLTISTPMGVKSRFSNLTHLSMAFPTFALPSANGNLGMVRLWTKLCRTLSCQPTLTHLSLAGWPSPAEDQTNYQKALGEIDVAFSQLSKHLICLKWLDISGIGYAVEPQISGFCVGLTKGERLIVEALLGRAYNLASPHSRFGMDGELIPRPSNVQWNKHWRSMETIVWKNIYEEILPPHSQCKFNSRNCYTCYHEGLFRTNNPPGEGISLAALSIQEEPPMTELDQEYASQQKQRMARNDLAKQLQRRIRDDRVSASNNGNGGGGTLNCKVITE